VPKTKHGKGGAPAKPTKKNAPAKPTKKNEPTKKAPTSAGERGPGEGVDGEVALSELSVADERWDDDARGPSLGFEDRQLLGKVARFLATIVAPRLLRRAVGAGYSRAEHEELWRLYLAAAGREQPLDLAFAAIDADAEADASEVTARLAELDAFENEWLPKTLVIIERQVPEADVARFVAAFFKDLKQQPLGPRVIDSVSTYLDRVEALASSAEPGAEAVLRALRGRRLTEAKIAATRALVDELKSFGATPRTAIDPDVWREAHERQARALRELRLAWNDWSTTLRRVFGVREQVQLALTEVKVRAEAEPPPPTPGPDAPT
jgi:hypothetical protein